MHATGTFQGDEHFRGDRTNLRRALSGFSHQAKRGCRNLAILAIMAVAIHGAQAQVDAGSVQGQVTDASGAVIPNALVTLRNEDTGINESTHADEHGNYSFSPVRIGVYTLSAEMQGFEREEREHLRRRYPAATGRFLNIESRFSAASPLW